MGTRYTTVSISGYNSSPPPDDGSTGSDNQITWSKHKTKIGDPIKNAVESIDSKLVTALNQESRSITSNDSAVAGDHLKTIEIASTVSTSVVTLSLGDAASMANGYIVNVVNRSSYPQTIGRVTTADGINGTATNVTIASLQAMAFAVNSGATGYNILSGSGSFNNVTLPDGSAAAPSLKIGDEQNGLFSPSASSVGVTLNGIQRASFSTTGFTYSLSSSGALITSGVTNGSNTADSNAAFIATVAGTSAADPYTRYTVTGGTSWASGLDNSDSDSYKISNNTTLGTNDYLTITTGGAVLVGDTANANNLAGLTVNQGAADDHVATFKSSDVAHSLTTGGGAVAETDDFALFQKLDATGGGLAMQVMRENDTGASAFTINVYGGEGTTTDTTGSTGLWNVNIAEHDGANATIAAPANQNVFSIRAATGAATYATRLLLKGDDGELHLGNSTPVALDEEDDIAAVRGLQMLVSGGRGIVGTPHDNIAYNYQGLKRIGVVGEADEKGEFLIRVQPILNLHHGALWQLFTMIQDQAKLIKEQATQLAEVKKLLPG